MISSAAQEKVQDALGNRLNGSGRSLFRFLWYVYFASLGLVFFNWARLGAFGLSIPYAVSLLIPIVIVGVFSSALEKVPSSLIIVWYLLSLGAVLSTLLNPDTASIPGLLDISVNVTTALIVAMSLQDEGFIKRIVLITAIVLLMLCVKGFYDLYTDPFQRLLAINPGNIGSRNVIAFFVEPFFVLLLAVILISPPASTLHRVFFYVALGIFGSTLIASFSRGAWVSTFIGLLLIRRISPRLLILPTVALLVLFFLGPLNAETTLLRFQSIFTFEQLPTGMEGTLQNSNLTRVNRLLSGLDTIASSPLFGLGPGSLRDTPLPHNSFIYAWIEIGIVGFLGFFSLLSALTHNLSNAISRAEQTEYRAYLIGFRAAVVTYFVHFFFVDWFNNLYTWSFLGLAFAASCLGRFSRKRQSDLPSGGR